MRRLDEEEQRRADGRHIEISVMVLGTNENNLQYGVDIARLVKEKLLDVVYVYQFDFGATKGGATTPNFFRQACGSQGVPYLPTVDPPYDLKGQLLQALELYESGAAGLTFWDAGGVDTYMWADSIAVGSHRRSSLAAQELGHGESRRGTFISTNGGELNEWMCGSQSIGEVESRSLPPPIRAALPGKNEGVSIRDTEPPCE